MRCSMGLVFYFLLLPASAAWATVTTTGNVNPADPSTWNLSTNVYVGYSDNGIFTGTVEATDSFLLSGFSSFIGYDSSSEGTVVLSSQNGGTWNVEAELHVGYEGTGTLNILGNALFHCDCFAYLTPPGTPPDTVGLYAGNEPNSLGTINVGYAVYDPITETWSRATCESEGIDIGYEGTGYLNVINGGKTSCTGMYIGRLSGSEGHVSVSGQATHSGADPLPSELSVGMNLYIGFEDDGDLTINTEGEVHVGDTTYVNCHYTGDGEIELTSGTGFIHFDSNPGVGDPTGTLYTGALLAGLNQLTGTGTVETRGIIIDVDNVEISDPQSEATTSFSYTNATGTVTIELNNEGYSEYFGAGYSSGQTVAATISGGVNYHSENGIIGFQSSANGTVTVNGTDSKWTLYCGDYGTSDTNLYVGYKGDGTLNITGGGCVDQDASYIGTNSYVGYASGSTGLVRIDMTGSTFNTEHLYIGNANGATGQVEVGFYVPEGYVDNGNPVPYGTLDCDDLYIGNEGKGSLLIGNRGIVISETSYIGYAADPDTSDNKVSGGYVRVGGPAAFWNTGDLYVGYNSSTYYDDHEDVFKAGGELYITGLGARVESNGDCYIGYGDGSTGEVTVHDSGTLRCTGNLTVGRDNGYSESGTGVLNITVLGFVYADTLTIGTNGTVNIDTGGQLRLTGNQAFNGWDNTWGSNFNFTNGTVEFASGAVATTVTSTVDTTLGANQTLSVTDGCYWNSTSYDMNVDGGTLKIINDPENDPEDNIQDGGTVSSINGRIGSGASSTGTAIVDGAISNWTMTGDLYVGHNSGTGTMNITNGGSVSNTTGIVGEGLGSTGTVNVNGIGSTWTNNFLLVGSSGNGTLNIYDQGSVSTSDLSIGTNGTLNLDGGTLELTDDFAFANWSSTWGSGMFNFNNGTVEVSSGAVVTASVDTVLGTNQKLMITGTDASTGTGTQWNNGTLDMCVNDGELEVSAGGTLISQNGYIGSGSGSTGVATLDGPGTSWTVSHYYFTIGDDNGSYGELNVRNDATLNNLYSCNIGRYAGSTGVVNVDNATWNSGTGYHSINVGLEGNGTLNIRNGTVVSGCRGLIAYGSDAVGKVTVDGVGSRWDNSYYLFYVGYNGTGTLEITNGGVVNAGSSNFIGDMSGSHGTVLVDGDGSTLTTSGTLYVGCSGSGSLTISKGGAVNSVSSILARYSGASGTVTVTGDGSKWTNSGSLNIGYYGSGTVNILDGGLVSVGGTLNIGYSDEICIETGGMLALLGDADDSLTQFLALVTGTDRILWDPLGNDNWTSLTSATLGTDYWLSYIDDSSDDLYGYTKLTVGIAPTPPPSFSVAPTAPEPSTVALILTALMAIGLGRRFKRG